MPSVVWSNRILHINNIFPETSLPERGPTTGIIIGAIIGVIILIAIIGTVIALYRKRKAKVLGE